MTTPASPTFDYTTDLVGQLWTLLNADGSWKVPAANQIRYDTVFGTQDPEKDVTSEGDYPQARLYPISFKSTMFSDGATFETPAALNTLPLDWTEKQQYVFKLELVSQLLSMGEINPLYLEATNALRLGGPKLQKPYVKSWALAADNKLVGDEDDRASEQNQVRWRSSVTITIDCEMRATDLAQADGYDSDTIG